MRSKTFEGMVCSVAGVLAAVGDRWGMLIIRDISLGLHRYEDLRKSTHITNATLTDRLRHLEQNNLIERRPYQSRPTRYEYILTARGSDLAMVIMALAQVGDSWAVTGQEGPPLIFTNRLTGQPVKLALVDESTGEPVRLRDVHPQAGPGADDLTLWRLSKFEVA